MFSMMEYHHIVSYAAVTCLKLLVLPLFISTDFEAHRNWMAITSNISFKNWYDEDKSESTLNFPPFFAWFEYMLSCLAKYFDDRMLIMENINYQSTETWYFMRLSVILSDLVYFYGVNKFYKFTKKNSKAANDYFWEKKEVVFAMLMLFNPGLILLDQIHFQYHGLFYGILLISMTNVFEGDYVFAAFWYTVLLNFNHAFLCMAPAYYMFLLLKYCFTNLKRVSDGKVFHNNFSTSRCLKLGGVVGAVCLVSFGPFIYHGHMKQVISRLFSIKRVSVHPYSIPNIWVLYIFCDWILSFFWSCLTYMFYEDSGNSSVIVSAKGCELTLLPDIAPWFTIILVMLSILPIFGITWNKPTTPKIFIQCIILSAYGSYMFGYHVQESAILMILVPLTITAIPYVEEAKLFSFLSVMGHLSFYQLLHKDIGVGTSVEILLLFVYTLYVFYSLSNLHKVKTPLVGETDQKHLLRLFVLIGLYSGLQSLGLDNILPFRPALLISFYSMFAVLGIYQRYWEIIG